jgi:hypothetical protein
MVFSLLETDMYFLNHSEEVPCILKLSYQPNHLWVIFLFNASFVFIVYLYFTTNSTPATMNAAQQKMLKINKNCIISHLTIENIDLWM